MRPSIVHQVNDTVISKGPAASFRLIYKVLITAENTTKLKCISQFYTLCLELNLKARDVVLRFEEKF